MKVAIEPAGIDGLKLITPALVGDARGWFQETYRIEWDADLGFDMAFIQDNHAFSASRGVIRGLHFQFPGPQAKLVRVLEGAILDVAVDIRCASPTFGRHVSIELSAENRKQLFIPHGFAHGYATLSERVQVLYKVDAYYDPEAEFGLAWDDPALGIDWRLTNPPVLSEKDRRWPRLADFKTPF